MEARGDLQEAICKMAVDVEASAAEPHIAPAKCNRAMTDRAAVRPCAVAAAGALCASGAQERRQ